MYIITITNFLLFTVYVYSFKDQTRSDIISGTPYCDTPGEQYSKHSIKKNNITTYLLFIIDVHYSKDLTREEIRSCTQ